MRLRQVAGATQQEGCRRERALQSQKAIDPDADHGPDRERHRIEIGELSPGIERGEQQKGPDAARDRTDRQLERDQARTFRAAMMFGEMPLAPGAGCHDGYGLGPGDAAGAGRMLARITRIAPSTATANEAICATVNGPSTRILTRMNSRRNRNEAANRK